MYVCVDGSDPAWQQRYRKHVGGTCPPARCTDAGELQASVRSANLFAPWVRRIFVVTDRQHPAWLDLHARVTVVDHADIIPAEYLPVFSSHAIEPHLYKIPGLADRFVYANDDMLFGAPVRRDQFFDSAGRPLIVLADAVRGGDRRDTYGMACNSAADLLDGVFGPQSWHRGWHHMKPYCREMLAEITRRLPDAVDRSTRVKTRSAKGVAWDHAVWPAWSIASGYAVAPTGPAKLSAEYIGIGTEREKRAFDRAIVEHRQMVCVNISGPHTADRVNAFIERLIDPRAGNLPSERSARNPAMNNQTDSFTRMTFLST